MAKNLDHTTSSSQSTPKRQSLESAIASFLERRRADDTHDENDNHPTDEKPDTDAAPSKPEIVIVDPIDKTQESPVLTPPEPARRGGVPAFLAKSEEGVEDTALRPLPPHEARDADAKGEPIDTDVDDAYADELDDQGLAYSEFDDEYYDDFYDDEYYGAYDEYDDRPSRRGVRRGAVAALVAGVAIASFVAGGVCARFFMQAPTTLTETPAPLETQASLTEKTAPETIDTSDEVKNDSPEADNGSKATPESRTDKKTDTTTNGTGDDTGNGTTDGSGDSATKNRTDTQKQDPWRWEFDENGDNSISYDPDNREMTLDYEGYKVTVPITDEQDQYDQTYDPTGTDRTRDRRNTRDDTDYRGYDYGSDGSGTGWTRERTERDYQRKYDSWS